MIAAKGQTGRRAAPATVRVAIYCRQSVEDTTSTFNSLHAQREAVEAYVTSQRGAGWVALPERYDDGGYTGANMARPAFKRLMAEIEAGRVDVVAVYKIDRLSRSMLDFVRLMEAFKQSGVTFVSVTQQFSTTDAVGRMTLNLLATFAEFERECISERTKDKISAARRKGMWTGGRPVLGYDLVQKRLGPNKDEAEQVRAIFALYLECGSLMRAVEELNRRGWRAKSWTTAIGEQVRGGRFDKSSLRHLLRNPIYVGRTRLGTESFEGVHEAIVDREVWDAVQVRLRTNGQRGTPGSPNKYGHLLRGILFCGACGSAMQSTYARRGDRTWSYYVCGRMQQEGASTCPGSRVAVGELEAFVVARIRQVGIDPALVREAIAAARREREARLPELEADVRRSGVDKKRLESERTNLVSAVAGGGAGVGVLVERLGAVDEELAAVEARIEVARAELVTARVQALDEAELRAALASFDPVWDELFPRERARILALLIERITYRRADGEVSITFRPSGVKSLARPRAEDARGTRAESGGGEQPGRDQAGASA